MIETLQQAIQTEESLDIHYQAPGREAECRHVLTLLLEVRSGKYYLIAYCHTRRANRTFRLDRLQLADH